MVCLFAASITSSARIRIWILPGEDPEPEEVFLVSFVTASGGAVFDPSAPARVIITQRGMPFGVLGFAGEALDPRVFVEGSTAMQVHFPVSRTEGALGTVEVSVSMVTASIGQMFSSPHVHLCG